MTRIISLILLFFISCHLKAQILPEEDSHLNFRIIGFSFPQKKKTACTLEIAKGHFNTEDSFKKKIIKSIVCKTDKVIAEVPFWGSDYTWRIKHEGKKTIGGLYHFSIGTSTKIDTDNCHLKIVKTAEQYKDAYVFVDDAHVLYDMDGNAAWYLPEIDGKITENTLVRDLKKTSRGTITLIEGNDILEISFDGKIMWKGPDKGTVSGDTSEHYHHEFTRLDNGHYMAMGKQSVSWELPSNYKKDSSEPDIERGLIWDSNKNVYIQNLQFETIIEYDEAGNVKWSWRGSDYFKHSDLVNPNTGLFEFVDIHENSFFFDEDHKNLYVSCRNISRLLKIKYPEGIVTAEYGKKYRPGEKQMGNTMFCGQHSIKRSKEGYLYLFNNNSFDDNPLPKIEMLQEPVNEKDTLKVVWEYRCTFEGLSDSEINGFKTKIAHKRHRRERPMNIELRLQLTAGGNVMELPDRSFFVSTCAPFSKIFIVNKDKKILWNAIYKMRTSETQGPAMINLYRASIISHKELEQLIWNAEEPRPASPGRVPH